MRSLSSSQIYLRIRGLFGLFFIAAGATIIVRTSLMAAPSPAWIAPWVMGLAFIALGIVRIRIALSTWKSTEPSR